MIKYDKIKQLALENNKNWADDFLALCGGQKNRRTGVLTSEVSHKEFEARDFDLGKLTNIFCGGDLDKLDALTMESGGSAQMPSQFVDISAWSSTIGSLLDMVALDSFNRYATIGNNFCEVMPRTVRGGKLPRIYANQQNARNIPIGKPAPAVDTLKEGWVELPYPERDAKQIKLLKEDFTFDRSGTIIQAVEDEGAALAIYREERILLRLVGVLNDYVRDGYGFNGSINTSSQATFRTSGDTSTVVGGVTPFNYINSATGYDLLDWNVLANAEVLLQSNVSPYDNLPITMGEHPILLVDPYAVPNVSTILNATKNMRWNVSGTESADSVTYPELNREFANPVMGKYKLTSSWLLHKMLVTGKHFDGTVILDETGTAVSPISESIVKKLWWMANPKGLKWLEVYPFSSVDVTIAGEDAVSNVVVNKYISQYGNSAVVEPRYIGSFSG